MKRRTLIVCLAVLALAALVLAPAALAAGGGGSAGFGGGGEGGGGGGGGKGAALYFLIQILIRVAVLGHGLGALAIIAVVLVVVFFRVVTPRAQSFWSARENQGRAAKRRTAQREHRVELAAAEAAEEDPAFAPDAVKPAAAQLFKSVESAWDAGDRARLAQLLSPQLMVEWERRLDDFDRRGWRNRVELLDEPSVEYVGLTHRGDQGQDRVVVRIQARTRDYVVDARGNHIKRVGRMSETVTLREFWTLARGRDGQWILASIEQGAEGQHTLDDQIVATAWSDEQGMRDEALVEGAVQEAVPDGTKIAEVADLNFEGDAHAAALDLSLADGRFAPDVLEVAARQAVAAWAEAVDGSDRRLMAIATPQAIRELLHPGSDRTRLVVRGPVVKRIRIVGLDPAATPPTMAVEVDVVGRRYLEDRDTTEVLSGSRSKATGFTEHWTFALDGDGDQPWRIAVIGTAAASAART